MIYQDKGTGGKGKEQIGFSSTSALANGLYQLTLVGSGTNGIRDIAGNSPTSGDIVVTFARLRPQQRPRRLRRRRIDYVTDPTQPQGDRAESVPDHHRGARRRVGGRSARDSARRLHRERDAPARS